MLLSTNFCGTSVSYIKKACDVQDNYSPLLAIQTGTPGLAPLFCVPGAGGSVASFIELAIALGSSRPVYGLQPRGLDGEQIPHATVEAAAMSYLHSIQKQYPEGPLHLLGHSFGGWVVFDMAQHLAAEGRAIASLTLVDSETPNEDGQAARVYDRSDVIMELVEIYEQLAGRPLSIRRGDMDGLSDEAQIALLHMCLVQAGLMPKQSKPKTLHGTVKTFAAALRSSYRPMATYVRLMRLVLVRDEKFDDLSDQFRNEEVAAQWRLWAPNLVLFHSQGNHMTVLKRPHVDSLAAWLQLK